MSTATPGRNAGGEEPSARRGAELTASRRLLRRMIEVVAQPISPQQRLDQMVAMIARNLVAEVCSIYALRAGEVLELFASEGLASEAVHQQPECGLGKGWSVQLRLLATSSIPIALSSTQTSSISPKPKKRSIIPFWVCRILRGGRVIGVVVLQNTARRVYADDDVEALQIIASILAEMLASGGLVDRARYTDLPSFGETPARLDGQGLVEGVAVGRAWLHAPKVEITKLLSDEPQAEHDRLMVAIGELRQTLDKMIEELDVSSGEQREVIEAFRMFAHDGGWLRRIREAIDTGLTAEAAVRRVQEETRLRIGHASDPYLRERLVDLDDLANRLLMHLAGRDLAMEARALPASSIIVARNLSASELMEYDREKVQGIVLEEGSANGHVTIVARAIDVPVLGRVGRAMAQIDSGDRIALDGDNGQMFVRPSQDVITAFKSALKARKERRRQLSDLRDLPSITRDGIDVGLSINAAFIVDMSELESTGAEGVGLYRTELGFMTHRDFPSAETQAAYYGNVLDLAKSKPVTFRTLDIGGDKSLPYWRLPEEENPAMGWRATRLLLDRPQIFRVQLRALIRASAGRQLRLMFPMIAEVAEFDNAYRLLQVELAKSAERDNIRPISVEVGVMLEVPSLFWQMDALLKRVDFVSIGSNDLLQFLFACDRGAPNLVDRYDVLSPGALSFLRAVVVRCRKAGVRLSVCGEIAGRPLEAMALVGLGIHELSLSPAQIAPVKAMVRSLDAGLLGTFLREHLDDPDHSLRRPLLAYALDHHVVLPNYSS